MSDGADLGIEGLSNFREVGAGGFATVYAGWDAGFSRWVAVKVLHGLDDDGKRRFERERGFMGRLSEHPNVITPFRFGHTSTGAAYLVMEFLEGGSLQDVIERHGPVPWEQAVDYIVPIADALGHAHSTGILHRDVKPANILLTARGVPKLTDFGIGVVQAATATQIAFTLAHAPPETFADGYDRRDERSDLYSLASTLYSLVGGRAPFETTGQDSQAAHMRRIEIRPVPTLGLGPGPDGFLARAMAKNPSARPANAAEFIAQLNEERTRWKPPVSAPNPQTVVAQPPSQVHHSHTISSEQPAAFVGAGPGEISQARRSVGRSGAPFFIGALAAVAIAITGGLLVRGLSGGGDTSTETTIEAAAGDEEATTPDTIGDSTTDDPADDAPEGEEPIDETIEEVAQVTTFESLAAPVGDPVNAASIDVLEAEWADARAAVVETLNAGDYGVGADNILRGPGRFEANLSDCPQGWDNTALGSNEAILLGYTTALSGNLAAYGNIGAGMDVYFDYVNANGGIGGRRIEMITKDDQYLAAETIEKVDELIQVDNPFAISTLGTPGTLAVYDSVNTQCIPHPFVQTGHPAWGDPVNHPFTIGLQMTYTAEAGLWGDWIRENMAGQLPVRVSAIVMDNDFGLAYESGFENWIASNPGVVSEFVPVRHDPAAPELSGPVATAAAANPDVFISMTAGNPCLLAIQSAANQGMGESVVKFTPSVCAQVNAFVGPAGDAADGWRIVNGGQKASNDPAYANEAFIAFMNQQLAAAGYDPDIALYGTGFGLFAWTYVEALRIADQLDGGLTRSNLVLAMRSLNLVHPMLADGIRLTTFGLDDSYPIEGSEYATFNAVSQTWVVESVADLNGETPNCSWGASGC